MSDKPITKSMSPSDATDLLTEIRHGFTNLDSMQEVLRNQCMEFKDRKGYEALGFATLESCLDSMATFGSSNFYRLAKAGETVKMLQSKGTAAAKSAASKASTNAIVELGKIKDDSQQVTTFAHAIELASKDGVDEVSAEHIKSAAKKRKKLPPKETPQADPKPVAPKVVLNGSLIKNIEKIQRQVDELDESKYAMEKAELAALLRNVHNIASVIGVDA